MREAPATKWNLAALAAAAAVAVVYAANGQAAPNIPPFLHRVAVFSNSTDEVRDPRYQQPQTSAAKPFAPVGLVWTNQRVPDQVGSELAWSYHMGTAFLVSPCYVLTAYHVVFGTGKSKPDPEQHPTETFAVLGRKASAAPAEYGELYRFSGRDWALLRLDPDAQHRCLGEEPDIGWVKLAPLPTEKVVENAFSIIGYPIDKPGPLPWRQDGCHLYSKQSDIENDGLWETDCATRPRASGSPIFFLQDGVMNVIALMSGHVGDDDGKTVLPTWTPSHTNLALDIGKIASSDPDVLALVQRDIERFDHTSPGR